MMKGKTYIIIILSILTMLALSCGSSKNASSGITAVSITIGSAKTAALTTQSIPGGIHSIRFTISAPDMTAIVRIVFISNQDVITESFDIPNGLNRHFLVEAVNSEGDILFTGDAYADLDGTAKSIDIVMVGSDKEPPVFGGAKSLDIISDTSVEISWEPGTDNVTPQDEMVYLIYKSTEPFVSLASGGASPDGNLSSQSLDVPSYVTGPGATSFTITDLLPGVIYYFIVRAKDEAGNRDDNLVQLILDKEPPVFGGINTCGSSTYDGGGGGEVMSEINAASTGSTTLNWSPASDNITLPSGIVYLIYQATSLSGIDYSHFTYSVTGKTSYLVTGLTPGQIYFFVVRAMDKAGNKESNTEACWVTIESYDYIDLSITNVSYDSGTSQLNGFKIYNSGTLDAVDVTVCLVYFDGSFDIGYGDVVTVPAGSSITSTITTFPVYAPYYYIIVDPEGLVSESNESNNTACGGSFCSSPPSLGSCIG
jgi:hypothetical protein